MTRWRRSGCSPPSSVALLCLVALRDLLKLLRWSSVRSVAATPEVWHATARFPYEFVRTSVLIFSAMFIPVGLVIRAAYHQPWSAVPAAFVTIEVAVLFSATLQYFAIELMFRPLRRDVAEYLPQDFWPRHRPLSFRFRLLVVIVVVCLTTSLLLASAETGLHTSTSRITVGVGVAPLVAAVVGLLPASVLAQSERLSRQALTDAADRVQRGDLDGQIPLVDVDETTAIALSFNRMLGGLREREDLRSDLRESRTRIVTTADAERRRLERDLHDGAQQHLVLLNLKLSMADRLIETDPAAAKTLHRELRDDLQRALAQLRDLAHGIYPQALESEGLPGALKEAVQRAAIPTQLDCDGVRRYRHELEAAVYFCCLEALQNAAKHAGEGATASVHLAERDARLEFEVSDNGRGFDPAAAKRSAGVQNMTDRIGALGGTLALESAPGSGVCIRATIPLEAPS
jgi:signal transduction histidine kinase